MAFDKIVCDFFPGRDRCASPASRFFNRSVYDAFPIAVCEEHVREVPKNWKPIYKEEHPYTKVLSE